MTTPAIQNGQMTKNKTIRLIVGAILIMSGALLCWRPLTGTVIATPLLLLAVAGWLIMRAGRSRAWLVAAGLGTIMAAAGIVFLRQSIMLVPLAISAALVIAASRQAAQARTSTGATRIATLLTTVAAGLGAWLSLLWPDVALMLFSTLTWVAAIGLGVRLILKAWGVRAISTPRWLRVSAACLALVLALAMAGASVYLRSATPQAGDFYRWQGTIPVPGQVLRVQPYNGSVPGGARAVTMLYSTTYSDGSPAVASALVVIPDGPAPAGGRPVLAWQHGTTGVAQPCAPSLMTNALVPPNIPGIDEMIARGWLVVATDYPGMGTSGRYPYLIGEGEGRSTLDAVRASRHLPDLDVSDQVWLWGHSQGGHSTLWAGQIAPSYAPELHVLGVAALSSASDPLTLAELIMGHGIAGDLTTAWVLVPYADEYPDIALSDVVHPAGETLARQTANRCVLDRSLIVSVLVSWATQQDAPLYRVDLAGGPVRERLEANIANGIVPAPLFLGQGDADEAVSIRIQRALSPRVCGLGRPVETHEYPGASHMGVLDPASGLLKDLFAWADAVLAGQEPSNCR